MEQRPLSPDNLTGYYEGAQLNNAGSYRENDQQMPFADDLTGYYERAYLYDPSRYEYNPRKQRSLFGVYLFGIIAVVVILIGAIAALIILPGAPRPHHRDIAANELHSSNPNAEHASPKNCPSDVNTKDNGGRTPLFEAATFDKVDVARLLIDCGADVNAKSNDGTTPLVVAVFWGYVDIVRVLLDHGADVNAKDKYGYTPLHRANYEGHADVAALLRSRGGHE